MLFEYFQEHFQVFLVIFIRIFGLILILPVISNAPAMAKAGLSFFVALLSTPIIVSFNTIAYQTNIAAFGLNLLSSFTVGLAIGFIAHVTVSAVQLSSAIFSTTMGLTFSENINPLTQENIPALGNFLSVIILLLFIRTESHITFIEIIVNSFRELPIIQAYATHGLLISMKTITSMIFMLAIRISFPIISITLLLDLAMGIIGRVAPQFNVMIMGWNIKIFIGFTMLWLILPGILDIGSIVFQQLYDSIFQLLKIARLGGGING